ncbi:MAG: radical SAM protein [bacterium]|nr:radical SAM protein [bacterium]
MKILLIKPPNPKSIDLFDSEGLSPPLGLAYLASTLQKFNHQVQILDADVEGLDTHGVIQKIKKINPDIVGLTAVTPNFCEAVKIARLARKLKKPPVIILGGPHVSAVPKAVKIGCFNFAVLGEGEETLTELIEGIKAGKTNLENIKGLAFLKKQKLIITPPRPYLKNLDSLPFPAWDLLPPATNYHPTPGMYQNSPMMTVMTSRGCPFKCTFCDRSVFGNTYRARSPKNVVDEIEILLQRGIREIKIYDDTFNLDPKRVIGICQEIKRRQLKFTWSCLCRVNFIEKEMLSFMKKAGCWQISLGIESGNNEVLKAVCKSETTEMIEKAVNLIHEAGIETRGFFILGLPCETEKSLEETIDFAKSLKLEMANFYHLIPFPGTEIYKKARKFGHFKKGGSTKEYLPHSNSALPFVPYGLTNAKMRQYFKKAYHDFYFRPSYLTKRILGIRSFSQVRKYAKAMWAILKI